MDGKPEGGDNLENVGIDRSVILQWILGKFGGKGGY
jgi:hypothetical protein